jgi:ribose transport system permease protein
MKSILARHQKTLIIAALLVLLTVICTALEPRFISRDGVGLILKYAGLYGIIALGVSFVIITGGIDLSIGSWIGLSAVLFPVLMRDYGMGAGSAVAAVLGISAMAGVLHGVLVTKLRLQPFLVTLCGLFIYRGLARIVGGNREQMVPPGAQWMREGLVKGQPLGDLPVPAVFLLLLALAALAAVFLNQTVWGRHLVATGRNEQAARFSGVRTDAVRIMAYVICSLLAGLAGILFLLEVNSAQGSGFGNFYELWAIAGAVLGGCSLRGGQAGVAGVLLGILMVAEVRQAVGLIVRDEFKEFVIGCFILGGVVADEVLSRFLSRRR